MEPVSPEFDTKARAVANQVVAAHNAQSPSEVREHLHSYLGLLACVPDQALHQTESLGVCLSVARAHGEISSALEIESYLDAIIGPPEIPNVSDNIQTSIDRLNAIIDIYNQGKDHEARQLLRSWADDYGNPETAHFHNDHRFTEVLDLSIELHLPGVVAKMKNVERSIMAQKAKVTASPAHLQPVLYNIDYPFSVTIETFAKCNATCSFCPYTALEAESERAGVRMDETLFKKIIKDLKDIPSTQALTINLSRVNEPLLDKRIFEFLHHVSDELPTASMWLPSNGSTLTDKNVERLCQIPRFCRLSISLNRHEKADYEDVMGLKFDDTLAKLDRLHDRFELGEIPFQVAITQVQPNDEKSHAFNLWCRERFPAFEPSRYYPTDWLGLTDNETVHADVKLYGCGDWYQVHILADGTEALCCFDGAGQFSKANARDTHILDMYNAPWQRRLRRYLSSRQNPGAPEICKNCTIRS